MEALKCHTTCDFLGSKHVQKREDIQLKSFYTTFFPWNVILVFQVGTASAWCALGSILVYMKKIEQQIKYKEKRREHKIQARAEKGKQQKVENWVVIVEAVVVLLRGMW